MKGMKNKKWIKPVLFAVVASAALAACGDGGEKPVEEVPVTPTFTIGGTVSGLTGTGLVLQNNAGNDFAVSSNGNFTFNTRLAGGAVYSVTVKTQPTTPDQTCVVASGSGTVAAANVANVAVTCSAPPPPAAFTIGGTVSGLNGAVVLRNNGGGDLTISANGAFTFPGNVSNGAAYAVTVRTQPASPSQVCAVSNASGNVSGASVSDIGVTCVAFLTVTSTTPADNASSVARDDRITVQFSANVDPATVNATHITLASPTGAKAITFITLDNQVTVIPTGNFLPATRYTLVISAGVRGAAGERLAGAVSRSFAVRDGQWGAPRQIQTSSLPAHPTSRIGMDASGNAIAVWSERNGTESKLMSSRYAAGATWGTAVTVDLDGHEAVAADLAVNAAGEAVVVWTDSMPGAILGFVARYLPAGGWQPEVLLAQLTSYMQVALNASGDAIAVWEESSAIWAKRYVAGAGWEASAIVAVGSAGYPKVAIDKTGNAMALWMQLNGPYFDLWSKRYVAGSGWQDAALLETTSNTSHGQPEIGFDPNGDAIATFSQTWPNLGPNSIFMTRQVPGSGWQVPTFLESDEFAPGHDQNQAIDASGNIMVVWQHINLARGENDIWANRYVVGTGWSGPTLIETRDGNALYSQVAGDPSGNAIAVWTQREGTRDSVWANRFVAGTGWGIAQLLETEDGTVFSPQIAVDGDGNAFAIWMQMLPDGSSSRIYVSRFE